MNALDPIVQADAAGLTQALATLRAGELVAVPTETVYGLAADAHSDKALRRIFTLKGRPAEHPLILHLGAVDWLERYAASVPTYARALAEAHWPGPLTLVLPASLEVSRVATGGADTVALRMPGHPVTLALLRAFGRAIAAPSANRYGSISPTRAADVLAEFGAETPLVLDGGSCSHGIESTIIDCTGAQPRLLRPGSIRLQGLTALPDAEGPRASGRKLRHYAPNTPAWRVATGDWDQLAARAAGATGRLQLLALDRLPAGCSGLSLPADADRYAEGLYRSLRELDRRGADAIYVQLPADTPEWMAVRDRLSRATQAYTGSARGNQVSTAG
jgi:L-threonylcarbamoyladenylate synthase